MKPATPATEPSRHNNPIPGIGWAILALWFTGPLAAGAAGVFEQGPTEAPLPIIAAVAFPVLVFALAGARRASGSSPSASICAS